MMTTDIRNRPNTSSIHPALGFVNTWDRRSTLNSDSRTTAVSFAVKVKFAILGLERPNSPDMSNRSKGTRAEAATGMRREFLYNCMRLACNVEFGYYA